MYISKTKRQSFHNEINNSNQYFVFGLVLLNLFNLFSDFQDRFGIPSIVKYILISLVLAVIIFKLISVELTYKYSKVAGFILLIFCIRTFFLLSSSFSASYFFVQNLFINQIYFLPYFLPIVILFTQFDIYFFKDLLRISYILMFIGIAGQLIYLIVGVGQNINIVLGMFLSFPLLAGSAILMMISHLYQNKNVLNFSLIYFLTGIIIIALLGRRGGVAIFIYYFAFFIIIKLQSRLIQNARKKVYLNWVFCIFTIFLLSYSYLENHVLAFQRGFSSQGWDESRGSVMNAFFKDFSSTTDWLLGRGLNGMILRDETARESLKGAVVENGYLTVLLKGGLFYLIPMVLLFLIASYLGYFKTKNDLTKALAAIIIIQLLCMISYGIPETSSGYIITWICVSACYSGRLRNITNIEVIKILNYTAKSGRGINPKKQ